MSDELKNEIKEKVASLDQRIKEAREDQEDYEEMQYGTSVEETPDEKRGKRAASEFLANVLAGALLGFVIDKYCDTAPVGMIFFIIMGFVGGVYRANTITKN